MFKDADNLRVRKLLRESAMLDGMIAEVKSKALLLKNVVTAEQAKCDRPSRQFYKTVIRKQRKMKRDLATYSARLRNIAEEINELDRTVQ